MFMWSREPHPDGEVFRVSEMALNSSAPLETCEREHDITAAHDSTVPLRTGGDAVAVQLCAAPDVNPRRADPDCGTLRVRVHADKRQTVGQTK